MFDFQGKKTKVSAAAHTIESSTFIKPGEKKKSHSQVHTQKNKKKAQVQAVIEQQKLEIEKLKDPSHWHQPTAICNSYYTIYVLHACGCREAIENIIDWWETISRDHYGP